MTTLDYTLAIPSHVNLNSAMRSPPFSVSSRVCGFGEYEEFSPNDFKAYQTAQKTHALIAATLIGTATAGVVIATLFFQPLIWAAPFPLAGLAILGVRYYLKYRASQNHFPPSLTADLSPQNFQAKHTGELIQENGSAHVLSDAV